MLVNREQNIIQLCDQNIPKLLEYRQYKNIKPIQLKNIDSIFTCINKSNEEVFVMVMITKGITPKQIFQSIQNSIKNVKQLIIIHNSTQVQLKSVKQYIEKFPNIQIQNISYKYLLFDFPNHKYVEQSQLIDKYTDDKFINQMNTQKKKEFNLPKKNSQEDIICIWLGAQPGDILLTQKINYTTPYSLVYEYVI